MPGGDLIRRTAVEAFIGLRNRGEENRYAILVMANNPAIGVPHFHDLAEGRAAFCLERQALQRDVEYVAFQRLAVLAQKAQGGHGWHALMHSLSRGWELSVLNHSVEFFNQALPLCFAACEPDAQRVFRPVTRDRFEAAQALDKNNDRRSGPQWRSATDSDAACGNIHHEAFQCRRGAPNEQRAVEHRLDALVPAHLKRKALSQGAKPSRHEPSPRR